MTAVERLTAEYEAANRADDDARYAEIERAFDAAYDTAAERVGELAPDDVFDEARSAAALERLGLTAATSRTCPGTGELPAEWSEKTRRGLCPVCHRPRVSIKKDGRLREHTPYESVRVSIPTAATR